MHPRLQDRHPSSGMTHCSHTNAPHVPHSRTQWVHTPSPHPSHVCQHSSHIHMPHVRHWWSAPGNGLAFQQSRFSHSNRIWRFATSRISSATSQRRESSFTSVPYAASNQSDNESGTSDSQRSIWAAISARPSAFFLKSFPKGEKAEAMKRLLPTVRKSDLVRIVIPCGDGKNLYAIYPLAMAADDTKSDRG